MVGGGCAPQTHLQFRGAALRRPPAIPELRPLDPLHTKGLRLPDPPAYQGAAPPGLPAKPGSSAPQDLQVICSSNDPTVSDLLKKTRNEKMISDLLLRTPLKESECLTKSNFRMVSLYCLWSGLLLMS